MLTTPVPGQIILLTLTFGTPILRYVAIGIALLPVVYLGAAIGLPLGNRMPKRILRLVAHLILLAIRISAAVPAFLERIG